MFEPISDWASPEVERRYITAWTVQAPPEMLVELLHDEIFAVRSAAFFNPSVPLAALQELALSSTGWQSYRLDRYGVATGQQYGSFVFTWSAADYPKGRPLVTAQTCRNRTVITAAEHLRSRQDPGYTPRRPSGRPAGNPLPLPASGPRPPAGAARQSRPPNPYRQHTQY
jgi:hypothetical protein